MLGLCACTTDYGYRIRSGRIVYDTPPRPAGQQSMLGFACDPIDTVRIGVIGLGDRGITGLLLGLVSVTAVLGIMDNMDEREISVNAAFIVPAAAVFGPHFSVCAANAPELVVPLVIAKLSGAVCAVLFTFLRLRKKDRQTAA